MSRSGLIEGFSWHDNQHGQHPQVVYVVFSLYPHNIGRGVPVALGCGLDEVHEIGKSITCFFFLLLLFFLLFFFCDWEG
jgi:hypothetical protein